MGRKSNDEAISIATSMINLVISAINSGDDDLLRDTSSIIEEMIAHDPRLTTKVFKAILVIAAEEISKTTEEE